MSKTVIIEIESGIPTVTAPKGVSVAIIDRDSRVEVNSYLAHLTDDNGNDYEEFMTEEEIDKLKESVNDLSRK